MGYTVCVNSDPGDDAWSTEPGDHTGDLQRNDPERRVEYHEVVGVATEHGVSAVPRADHDGCTNDVSGVRMPTRRVTSEALAKAAKPGGPALHDLGRNSRNALEPDTEFKGPFESHASGNRLRTSSSCRGSTGIPSARR